ncbi:MAG TPA: hypothetical protein VEH81_07360 [Ktedonobacteraceae bacterium]|nr:hypothetical protein [Ktedonobacteraceae bacterium]
MRHPFSSLLVRLPKQAYRVALLVVLIGAILAFGIMTFVPTAHAKAQASPTVV